MHMLVDSQNRVSTRLLSMLHVLETSRTKGIGRRQVTLRRGPAVPVASLYTKDKIEGRE
jgi:hypothetical protein